ncbi:patatin family phospholipase [Trypanosoma rangeli]|uniref:Patatin family phospholipase n=1 Tax=Trypanosoma rangeli TaxID=5698 RepID=A0A422N5R5_TRYRA|nr:patatin family phospholipase [Trypanosoma rangeli]RNF00781.1 patatin family phospholipase [Trypanosoma rangeli]|eukprot:RNF00781.1 patatin family phospholipase [Trypanosoma rangeli]
MSQGLLHRCIWVLWSVLYLLWEVFAGIFGIPLGSPTHLVLTKRARAARTYEEWIIIARQLDNLNGFQAWRLREEPGYMNFHGLFARIGLLTALKREGDVEALLTVLTSLQRSVFGITNPNLYRYLSGTKAVIEAYNSLLVYLIQKLAHDTTVDSRKKYSTLVQAARVYGRTTLVFHGDMLMGRFHLGAAKTLWKANLLPQLFCGGGTGALVAAFLCCKRNLTELFEMEDAEFDVFSNKVFGLFDWSWQRFWDVGHFLNIHVLVEFVQEHVGDLTFLEAYRLTGRVLNIEYTPETLGSIYTTSPPLRLLNYLTAPSVLVYSAVAASFASMPILFERYPLLAKDLNGSVVPYDPPVMGCVGRRSDGKIDSFERLRELFHIKCFIVSECSVSQLLFLQLAGRTSLPARLCHAVLQEWWRLASFVVYFTPWQKYVWDFLSEGEMGVGDVIKVFPTASLSDVVAFFQAQPPFIQVFREDILRGEMQFWPVLERIREQLAAELVLNDVLNELRHGDEALFVEDEGPYTG